eukprot:TRINITY_DN4700_c0_g1_i14.p1 TRINITY_DN4700_c0_g1~~TRINITY_DN4700_c0_g1_i14.p1  ORF type:complete len:211 (-),score=38.74 TRINITY_DN4700_c0_g1_i14:509-1141(-)
MSCSCLKLLKQIDMSSWLWSSSQQKMAISLISSSLVEDWMRIKPENSSNRSFQLLNTVTSKGSSTETCIIDLSLFHLFSFNSRRKIENAMLDSREDIYMLNFDLSDVMVNERFSGCKGGSIPYAGPEVFDDVVPSDSVAPAYDVWSCGVVLYVLLVGRFPFDCERILDSFNRIKGGIYEIPDFVSNEARDLISKMLVVDPARRITVEQIK